MIPACSHAIVDEAHQLEDIATQYFGFSVSNYRVEDYARDVERFARSGAARRPPTQDEIEKAVDRAARPRARVLQRAGLRASRRPIASRGEERVRVDRRVARRDARGGRLPGRRARPARGDAGAARPAADRRRPTPSRRRTGCRGAGAAGRRNPRRAALPPAGRRSRPTSTSSSSAARAIFLRAAPIDVSAIIRELLLDRMRATVLTSATLTVDGRFDYIRDRLGITQRRRGAAAVGVRLRAAGDPVSAAADARSAVAGVRDGGRPGGRSKSCKRTRGRAFVLFTSYATLRAVQAIAEMALDYPILVQGTAPRSQLLRQFRETPHACCSPRRASGRAWTWSARR